MAHVESRGLPDSVYYWYMVIMLNKTPKYKWRKKYKFTVWETNDKELRWNKKILNKDENINRKVMWDACFNWICKIPSSLK